MLRDGRADGAGWESRSSGRRGTLSQRGRLAPADVVIAADSGLHHAQDLGLRVDVVVGDFEGYMHWLDVKTGEVVGRERIDKKRIITPPIEIDGALAGYSSTGELSAWRVK